MKRFVEDKKAGAFYKILTESDEIKQKIIVVPKSAVLIDDIRISSLHTNFLSNLSEITEEDFNRAVTDIVEKTLRLERVKTRFP